MEEEEEDSIDTTTTATTTTPLDKISTCPVCRMPFPSAQTPLHSVRPRIFPHFDFGFDDS
jgi:hypothetical protein